MNVLLRVRDRNTDVIEALFHLAHQVPVDRPIVGSLHPGAANKVDRAIREFIHANVWRRLFQNKRMSRDGLFKHSSTHGVFIIVRNPKDKIDTAGIASRNIRDDVPPDILIGDYDDLVVRRRYGRCDNANCFYGS